MKNERAVSTTDRGVGVLHGSHLLPFGFKEPAPVLWTVVAQLFVVSDGHVSVADLPQSAQPQVRYGSPADPQTHCTSARTKTNDHPLTRTLHSFDGALME